MSLQSSVHVPSLGVQLPGVQTCEWDNGGGRSVVGTVRTVDNPEHRAHLRWVIQTDRKGKKIFKIQKASGWPMHFSHKGGRRRPGRVSVEELIHCCRLCHWLSDVGELAGEQDSRSQKTTRGQAQATLNRAVEIRQKVQGLEELCFSSSVKPCDCKHPKTSSSSCKTSPLFEWFGSARPLNPVTLIIIHWPHEYITPWFTSFLHVQTTI